MDFPPLLTLARKAAKEFSAVAEFFNPDPPAHARLLSDLTRRNSQALWLEWLASHIAPTVIPPVGCPGWRRLRVPGGVLYALGSVYGLELVVSFGPTKQIAQLECPALDNPDAPDAPIRALVLAVLTVGSRGGA